MPLPCSVCLMFLRLLIVSRGACHRGITSGDVCLLMILIYYWLRRLGILVILLRILGILVVRLLTSGNGVGIHIRYLNIVRLSESYRPASWFL